MAQQTGETRDAIIEDTNKVISDVIEANRNRSEPYWIILFAKPSKNSVQGKPALIQTVKAYGVRPPSYMGAVIGKVDNSKGTISWDVNMPQTNFNFDALSLVGAQPCDEIVIETTTIPGAYITQ